MDTVDLASCFEVCNVRKLFYCYHNVLWSMKLDQLLHLADYTIQTQWHWETSLACTVQGC